MLRRTTEAVLLSALMFLAGCHDRCFLVAGCHTAERVVVDGRILNGVSGFPVPNTVVTLLAQTQAGTDSVRGVTDSQGLFSLAIPVTNGPPDTISLRVAPPRKSGYLVSPLACRLVTSGGDACVLGPMVEEPAFPYFRFVYRRSPDRPVANSRITFRRVSGGRVAGLPAVDSVSVRTDAQGFVSLFGFDRVATTLDPIVGELTVDLPSPTGTVRRADYRIQATPYFNTAALAVQPVGPSLSYVMLFTDSATGRPIENVEMRFERRAGVATSREADTARSILDGRAFLNLTTDSQGSLTGDFFVTPPGSGRTTPIPGVVLPTFEADSSIVFRRWKVGTTGILYMVTPP